MINPKFNEIPVSREDKKDIPESDLKNTEQNKKLRRGLSINETVAKDATLSAGSGGVDTSGVRSGAGAGAGMTRVTPGTSGESPAPTIVPDSPSLGTTPRSSSGTDEVPTVRLDDESISTPEKEIGSSRSRVAVRAYQCWQERGCPDGSPEDDWYRAEQELEFEHQHR